jgi:hypothetical protein
MPVALANIFDRKNSEMNVFLHREIHIDEKNQGIEVSLSQFVLQLTIKFYKNKRTAETAKIPGRD